MKKTITTFAFAFAISGSMIAQSFNFSVGKRRTVSPISDPEVEAFENGNNKYVLFSTYSMKEGMQLQLHGFKANNEYLNSKKLYVPEEKMLIALYEGLLKLNNNMQLVKSVFSKELKKTTVYAHSVNEFGDVNEETKKELVSIPAEKAMNSGNFSCATSPNKQFAVILSEFPFDKETKEKIMVTVVDQQLKTILSREFVLPYDSKRGVNNTPVVADDGSVYIIKKYTLPKMPEMLTVFSVSSNGELFKENIVQLNDPQKYESFNYSLNNKNDLIVTGFYTEDGKVSFGGTKQKGIYYMQVNTKGDIVSNKTTAFEKHFTGLTIRQVLVSADNERTALIAESYSKRNNSSVGAGNQLVYSTEYNEGDGFTFMLNEKGEFIKSQQFQKSQQSFNDGGLYGSIFGAFVNDKLTVVYNDFQYKHDGKKYVVVPFDLTNVKIPIITILDKNGNIENEYPAIDGLIGGKRNEINLLPLTGYQLSTNKLFFIGSKYEDNMPVMLELK